MAPSGWRFYHFLYGWLWCNNIPCVYYFQFIHNVFLLYKSFVREIQGKISLNRRMNEKPTEVVGCSFEIRSGDHVCDSNFNEFPKNSGTKPTSTLIVNNQSKIDVRCKGSPSVCLEEYFCNCRPLLGRVIEASGGAALGAGPRAV